MKSDVILSVENLSFSYNHHLILKDINLQIKKGDFLAIIGPNGGGKSTLVKCILGFLTPQKGRIFLWGKPVNEFKHWEKIGYVPQRAGDTVDSLFPLTVEEFLSLPAKWYKKNIKKEVLEKLIEVFGIKSFLRQRLGELSYGQLQRAYIVRALILEPEFLILDEPSVGLDFFSQEIFYKTLFELRKKGLTILLITHETWIIRKNVNKIACLNQKLFFHGSHEEFCIFAEKEISKAYHIIEHSHW